MAVDPDVNLLTHGVNANMGLTSGSILQPQLVRILNEIFWAVPSRGTVCYTVQGAVLILNFVDENLEWYHSNEGSWAVFSLPSGGINLILNISQHNIC